MSTIAFTFNVKTSEAEEQAEYDTPETVQMISAVLRELGHRVVPIDVGCPIERLVAKLREAEADVVFNTAEGASGRMREALYPAIFDQLGLPYTGSDSYTLALTLDKWLSKLVAEQNGVSGPRQVLRCAGDGNGKTYPLPCIVKPNYEGSSKGVTSASVVTDGRVLHETVDRVLRRYPEGVLVEEYIPGFDVTVPYIEGLGPEVMVPCSYKLPEDYDNPHRLYDYALKNSLSDRVEVLCPAPLTARVSEGIRSQARKLVKAFHLQGAARLDFRVRDDGTVFFLEVNATPSMEQGASLFVSAQGQGHGYAEVLGHLVQTALKRKRRKAF